MKKIKQNKNKIKQKKASVFLFVLSLVCLVGQPGVQIFTIMCFKVPVERIGLKKGRPSRRNLQIAKTTHCVLTTASLGSVSI